MRIRTAAGDHKFDHAILMAPHKAGDLAWLAGTVSANSNGWAEVDQLTMQVAGDERAFVIGDAIQAVSSLPFRYYPKSAHIANRLGRIVAYQISERLAGRTPENTLAQIEHRNNFATVRQQSCHPYRSLRHMLESLQRHYFAHSVRRQCVAVWPQTEQQMQRGRFRYRVQRHCLNLKAANSAAQIVGNIAHVFNSHTSLVQRLNRLATGLGQLAQGLLNLLCTARLRLHTFADLQHLGC